MPSNYDDVMIDKINYQRRKEKEALEFLESFSLYLNGVEPVESLKEMLKYCKGDTIEEKITSYFVTFGGSREDFLTIIPEQRKKYYENKGDKLRNSSLKSSGAKTVKAERKKKSISKSKYMSLLLSVILIISSLIPIGLVGKEIIEEIKYDQAIERIEDGYLIQDLGFSVDEAQKTSIEDLENFDVVDFKEYLESLGLSEHSIIYITYLTAGREKADELCIRCYYAGFDIILRNDFPREYNTGHKYGDIEQLANHCQKEITEKGLEIMEILKQYTGKGIGGKH